MVDMRALIFDFDGTLIDSAPSILSSFHVVLNRLGIDAKVELTSSLIGPPLMQTLSLISGSEDKAVLDELATSFKEFYDAEGFKDSLVYPGIDEALKQLVLNGAELFIVTNKRILPTLKILDCLGWSKLFKGVYSQDAFKPPLSSKAEVIGKVLTHHGIKPSEAIYVGDRTEDGEAAQVNGMGFCWVTWGYGEQVQLSDFKHSLSIAEVQELLHLETYSSTKGVA